MSQFSDVRDPTIQAQAESMLRMLLRKNVIVRHSYKDIYFQNKELYIVMYGTSCVQKLFKKL